MVCRTSADSNFPIAPESVFVDLKISILKPIHAKWVTQYYDHIRTDEDIVKNGWRRGGVTKPIKKKYLQRRSIWKLDYIRSIFVWTWFQKEKLWYFFNILWSLSNFPCHLQTIFFRREFRSDVQLHWIESLKINSSCSIKQHILTFNSFRLLLIGF